jgi:hypothetical protein
MQVTIYIKHATQRAETLLTIKNVVKRRSRRHLYSNVARHSNISANPFVIVNFK